MKPFSVTLHTGETELWASSKDAPGYVEALVLLVYAPDARTADDLARLWCMRRSIPLPIATYASALEETAPKPKTLVKDTRCCVPQVDGDYRFHAQTCKHASPTGLPVYIDNRGSKS